MGVLERLQQDKAVMLDGVFFCLQKIKHGGK